MQNFSGTRLRQLREYAGLSRAQLAVATQRGQDSVTAWELGRSRPSIDALIAAADALGVPVGDLFEDQPESVSA